MILSMLMYIYIPPQFEDISLHKRGLKYTFFTSVVGFKWIYQLCLSLYGQVFMLSLLGLLFDRWVHSSL